MKVSEGIFRDVLRLFVWFPLRWLVLAFPVSTGFKVLRCMGDIHFSLSKGKIRMLEENLARMKGKEKTGKGHDARAMKAYCRNHYIDRLCIFIFPKLGVREIENLIEIEGRQFLDRALQDGKGAVLVHGHFGPVHIPLVVLARLGYRMKQIGLPSDEGLSWIGRNIAYKLRLRYEAMMPAEVIVADTFLRPAFRWLHDNGVIMITGDGSGTERKLGAHETFAFSGHNIRFPLGPALLSQKTGAALLPMFIIPGEKKLYKIVIEAPLTSMETNRKYAYDVTDQFIKRLEYYVDTYPGYWHFLDIFQFITDEKHEKEQKKK